MGAQRGDLLRLVLRQGMTVAGIGIAAGLVMARTFIPVFATFLPLRVQAGDPMTFIAAAIVVFAISLVASYIPARRATRVDPLVALRYE